MLIFSRDLDPPIFDQKELLDSLAALVTRHSEIKVRVLVQDIERVIKRGHRLIELSRRLTSAIASMGLG